MTLWDFLDANPWWGLTYLVLIVLCVIASVAAFADAKKKKSLGENIGEFMGALKDAEMKAEGKSN